MARVIPGTIPALLVLLAVAASAQKSPDVRLNVGTSPGAVYASSPSIACVGSTVVVAWTDDREGAGAVFVNRSLDGGRTWMDPDVRVSDPSSRAYGAQLAFEGSSVYVAWTDNRSGSSDVYANRSLDGGLTWLASDRRLDVDTAPGAETSRLPRIAAAGSSVYVVWEEERGAFSPIGDVHLNRSLDGGATWLPAEVRMDVGTGAFTHDSREPRIAADGAAIYVTWHELSGTRIHFNRSLDSGTTWLQESRRIDSSGSGTQASAYPDIAAVGPSVYVTWLDDRAAGVYSDIYFNRSLDGGTTWLPADVRVDLGTPPGARASISPVIAAAGTSVYVAWQEHNVSPSISDVYFNRSPDSGATWLANAIRLDVGDPPFAANSDEPAIAAAGSSVYVLWKDDRHDPFKSDVYFNRSVDGGTTWAPTDVRLNVGAAPGTASARGVRVAAAGGSVYAAWYEYRGGAGNPDVFFNLAAGHQPYGVGKPGSGAIVPTMVATTDPAIGSSLTLELAAGLGGASGLLLYGFTGPATLPVAGGALLVAPPIYREPLTLGGAPGVPGAGSLSHSIPVPLEVSLIGVSVNAQAGYFDAGALKGFSLTGGLEVWIL